MSAEVPASRGSFWLTIGAWLSFLAAALHVAVIIGGPDWYRFFGAGEPMARAAERGSMMPHLLTMGIVAILSIWGLYALSGAGKFRRLPLLRTGLVVISAIYLLRGLVIIPAFAINGSNIEPFAIWSSTIVLIYGVAYGLGTRLSWPVLGPANVR